MPYVTARIGRLLTPNSGAGSAPADGKAAPQTGAARPNPRLKEKLSEHPGNQYLPDP
jgi:hypothetical protein